MESDKTYHGKHRDITYITQNQEQCVAPSIRKRCEVSWVDTLVRYFYFLKNQLTKKTLEQVTNSRTLLLCFCIWIWGGTAKRSGHYLVESISITLKCYYRLECPSKGLTSLSSTLRHSCQTKPNYNKWFKQNASFRFLKNINKVGNYLLDGALKSWKDFKKINIAKANFRYIQAPIYMKHYTAFVISVIRLTKSTPISILNIQDVPRCSLC